MITAVMTTVTANDAPIKAYWLEKTVMVYLPQPKTRMTGNTRIVKLTPETPEIGFRYAKKGQKRQPGYGEKTEAAQRERQAKNKSKERFSGKNRHGSRR